ncbi:hypothetical protein [Aureibacter tunicatorum]|uniref:Uncharacterized protein n=1 Tax=Aureibacter tunicatorum TaxID=866807 RepID=A0AAE3XM35_9BACT|nr:hypothetical protein [Aureibacter tunicatorum]MDR6238469.1 hypothetical protein [Aureibacter tunicatorum]
MKSNKKLISTLEEVNDLVKQNDNISWGGLSPVETSKDLEIAINVLKDKKSIDKKHLQMLFAPTGLIQECSIVINWEKEYLRLSGQFDELILKIND